MSNKPRYKVGDTAVCRFCDEEIFFVGPHWLHPGNATPDHTGLPLEDLKLYCIDDGEQHWIAHVSEEALKEDAYKWYDIDPDNIEQITEWPPDIEFTIHLVDGFDGETYPKKPYHDDEGRWFVKATVREWLNAANPGDMIATSVY